MPAKCLLDCVELAAAVQLRSHSIKGHDSYRADELQSLSARLQLAAAGCLASLGQLHDAMGRLEVEQLLLTPRGESAITLAIRHNCKQFLSQPPVQNFLMSEWRGPLLHSVIEGASHDGDLFRLAAGCFLWTLTALANVLILPVIAAVPPLEYALVSRLKHAASEQLVAKATYKGPTRMGMPALSHSTVELLADLARPSAVSFKAVSSPSSPPPSPPMTPTVERWNSLSPSSIRSPRRLIPPPPASDTIWDEMDSRIPLLYYYVLRAPMFKFTLRLVSDVSLALLVTFQEGEPSPFIFFVWPVSGLIAEYKALIAADGSLRYELLSWLRSDTPSAYRADLFKAVDMLALHLLVVSDIAYYTERSAYLPLRSLAVLALFVRLLRLIYLLPTLGALVLILVQMTIDLCKLGVLLVFVLVALSSALFVVANRESIDFDECSDFQILQGSWQSYIQLLFIAANAVVDGRAQDAMLMCVLHDGNEHRYFLWLFTYLFLLFVVVLLLNMLIAMFTRTFDLMYDSMATVRTQAIEQ